VRPLLAERFLTVTFDYRGTGASADAAAGGPDWSTRLFADDAAAVLAALGRTNALVYGTSMGGRIAQELAINHAAVVGRLVLACTSPGGSVAHERGRDVRLALANPDPAVRFRAIVDLFYTPGWTQTQGGYDQVPTHLFGDPNMSAEAARRHLLVSAGHDAADRLHRIQAPTLIIHGDDDRMVPTANTAILGQRIPGSEVLLFPDGRHGFFDEFAEQTTKTVVDFLLADG
jgi:pimeloyl-ACP methyl ester carboxylesterase